MNDLPGPRKPPSASHALLFAVRRIPRRTVVIGVVAATLGIAAIAAVLMFTEFDWGELVRRIAALNAGWLLLAMMTLPLVGFPVLPVYLVAGARFGPYLGGVVVLAATAAHLVGSYLIAGSVLRRPLLRLLAKWHAHLPAIPADEEPAVALVAALAPGVPYVVRNYLLALMGLRLRIYFWIALPIYVARSYVSILLGDLGTDPDRGRLLLLAGVEALKAVICAIVIWRLREHHRRVHGDPVPHA